MTSNLGASEMNALVNPKLGFIACRPGKPAASGAMDQELDGKIVRSGLQAARKKFTPEFINRIDRIVTFRQLGPGQLQRILDIELEMVQRRIFRASAERSFIIEVTGPAKDLLLSEGTDMKYSARHLKRAVERLLVQPICSNDRYRPGTGGRQHQSGLESRFRSPHVHKGSRGASLLGHDRIAWQSEVRARASNKQEYLV